MRRGLWVLAIAIPVLLLIGDTLCWRYAEGQLQAGLHAWLLQRQASGWKTSLGQTASGGWPYAATLTVNGLTLQGGDPDIPGGVRLGFDRIALRVDLWRPNELGIAFAGQQRLRFGTGPDIPCTAEQLDATMALPFREPPHDIDLIARNLRAELPGDGAPGDRSPGDRTPGDRSPGDSSKRTALTVGLLQAHGALVPTASQDNPAAEFSVSAEAIGLPQDVKWPLGPILSSLTVDGTLQGKLPLGHGLTRAATEWRDGGGSLEVRHLALGWGPLGLTGSATLALDDQLQPMGAGTSHIVGYAAALDALASDGVLSRSAATAAKAVLSLLAGTPDDSDQSGVDVPLTLQYRTLSMRQVPLLRLPELDWPSP